MKLTEQQLANMFQSIKNTDVENNIDNLNASVAASDKRLNDVEKITNNSTLSASYQIINQLQDWSNAVGTDIELSLKPKFTATLLSWFKPGLATAAIITAVYFITPNITAELDHSNSIQQQADSIVFNASFEGKKDSDVIKNLSFDHKPTTPNKKPDTITKSSFG
jgi:hypothetical protein